MLQPEKDPSKHQKLVVTGKTNRDGTPELARLRLSPSKLMTLEACPASFKELILNPKDDGSIYTAAGKAAHTVIERINKGDTDFDRELFLRDKFDEELTKIGFGPDDGRPSIPHYTKTRDLINKYKIPDGWVLQEAEAKYVIPFRDFDFVYIIDATFFTDDGETLHIVDYKTSSSAPKSKLQLDLYAWITAVRKPQVLDYKMVSNYYMTQKGSYTGWVEYSRYDIEQIDQEIKDRVEEIGIMFKNNSFPTKPGQACFFCKVADCEDRRA